MVAHTMPNSSVQRSGSAVVTEAAAGPVEIVLQGFDRCAFAAIKAAVIAEGAVLILVKADGLALANAVVTLCVWMTIAVPALSRSRGCADSQQAGSQDYVFH
jgi:hypothetical protein